MKIPTTLKHKPVIVAENYDSIDGRGAYHSDAKGLSLGLAQWNDRGKVDISAKVWRHTGEKWSRQSEELPMHRVLDLPSCCAAPTCIFAMKRTAIHDIMTRSIRGSTVWACRATRWTLKYARKIPCWKKISACFTMCWARTASCWASDFPFWPGCCGRWDIDS